ncbi:FAD-dependent oxidoreductase, partial [Brenneria sp. 4F2]|nr:FAD-dependent oxidoreductase [Brenneria bubanii]
GAVVENRETGEEISVKSKVVVNATGPYSDLILQMDRNKDGFPDPAPPQPDHVSIANEVAVNKPEMVVPSAGVHIILPSYYCPQTVGLLDVKTADGRVMFFLPWQGKVLAGTTDIPMKTVP